MVALVAWLAFLVPIFEFVGLTNSWRAEHELAPLSIDAESQRAADAWTLEMVDRSYFEHADDLSIGVSDGWTLLGENVGRSTQQPNQAALIFEAFTRSPGHNKNLLQPEFTGIGVGVVTAEDGSMWVTMRFVARDASP